MSNTKTNEEILEEARKHTLREFRYAAQTLRSELAGAQRDIEQAIYAMDNGVRPVGAAGGPLGHQRPFDIAKAAAALESARTFAMSVGCTPESLEIAYAAGVVAGA